MSTRGAALRLISPGDTVDSNQPVIVVLVHGTFNPNLVFDRPPGRSPYPAGDELLASFDAQTGRIADFTILDSTQGRQVSDLSELGLTASLPAS
jgi:hypothetical protein